MVDLNDCVASVDILLVMYEETAGALRLDASKLVDREEYKLAQRAIVMAEFCETCSGAIDTLKFELATLD